MSIYKILRFCFRHLWGSSSPSSLAVDATSKVPYKAMGYIACSLKAFGN